jgi:16S rRNA A1518/A1519 N6-dimethyltransferase RsmA/KsgA/DIM1 with predicted DNA glycosylase/AP lyase activity
MFGNLPFHLASQLLVKWAREMHASRAALDMTLLLQREMAERVCSHEGSRDRNRLSVLVQNDFEASIAMGVSRAAFTPRPQVDASILRLVKRPTPRIAIDDFGQFTRFLQHLFAMKRKTVRQNLVHRVSARCKEAFLEHVGEGSSSSPAPRLTMSTSSSTDKAPSSLASMLLSRPEDLSLTQIGLLYTLWRTSIGPLDGPLA